MGRKTEFQEIGEATKVVWDRFWEVAAPYRSELWRYCRKITGSPWDAEDLLQDTLMKTFASLSALSHRTQPLNTRQYLFRVATNHWIDQCRKKKRVLDDYEDEKTPDPHNDYSLEVNDAIETLVIHLPPKQAVALVLTEAFQFKAKETADLMATTEGAVHALLNRARKNLSILQETAAGGQQPPATSEEKDVIQAFVAAFNRRDYQGVANLLDEHAVYSFNTQNSHEYGRESIKKYSLATAFKMKNMPFARVTELWGEPVVLFITETRNELNEVNRLVVEDGKIVKWVGYYFCRELMKDAADELQMKLEALDPRYLV
ncbi:MAG TPA: sigma-70 family RNA polymerase sigma factor [Bacillales bacterium]|nr:sigma-70 family RNA polymerase sigma factor [Bacillales bacterium]